MITEVDTEGAGLAPSTEEPQGTLMTAAPSEGLTPVSMCACGHSRASHHDSGAHACAYSGCGCAGFALAGQTQQVAQGDLLRPYDGESLMLSPDQIEPMPGQPRQTFSDEDIAELAQSIEPSGRATRISAGAW